MERDYNIGDEVWLKTEEQLHKEGWYYIRNMQNIKGNFVDGKGNGIWDAMINMLGKKYKIMDLHYGKAMLAEVYLTNESRATHYWFPVECLDESPVIKRYEKLRGLYENKI